MNAAEMPNPTRGFLSPRMMFYRDTADLYLRNKTQHNQDEKQTTWIHVNILKHIFEFPTPMV